MIIILEGADNSGKSTLAKRLSEDTGLPVIHPGGPPANIADAVVRCMEQDQLFNLSTELDFIFDRVTCISDRIYRGKPEYHNIFSLYQQAISLAKNVLVVYCNPSEDRLRNFDDHVTQAHEDEAVVNHAKMHIDRILEEYSDVMHDLSNHRHIKIVEYDFESDTDSESYKVIRSMINNNRDQ